MKITILQGWKPLCSDKDNFESSLVITRDEHTFKVLKDRYGPRCNIEHPIHSLNAFIKNYKKMHTQDFKVSNRIPPNKPSLDSLKAQGYEIFITHHRMMIKWVKSSFLTGKIVMVPDKEWRQSDEFVNFYPLELGGASEMVLTRGDEKITVRADCYHKDRFCRRTGISECLKKLERFYGIKA